MRSEAEGKAPGPAVVFDFDGTLIDTREIKTRNYLLAFEGIFKTAEAQRPVIVASCLRTSGANRFLQLQDTLEALGLEANAEQREAWSRLYSSLNGGSAAEVEEFPSVRPVLAQLHRSGFALFAASGILDDEFRGELERRDLSSQFLEAKGGDKLGFLLELRQRGFDPVLFVGDTEYDRETAARAGVHFFMVADDESIRALARMLTAEG